MTAPLCAYTPGTDVIDIAAPGGVEALLDFHRATFGDAVMRAANPGGGDPDDDPDDDGDGPDGGTGDTDPDGAGDPDDDGDDPGDDGDSDDDEGRDALGDKGKQALDRMKAKRKADRARIRALEQQIAEKSGDDGDKQRRESEAAATAKANKRILRSEIKAAAKGVMADPKDALTFLDLDQFEVDEDGDVDEDEIADAIAELVRNKPYLAAQGGRRFQGSAGGGAGKQSRPKQLTQADIDRLTPEQIVEARRKGQLDAVLKGTR